MCSWRMRIAITSLLSMAGVHSMQLIPVRECERRISRTGLLKGVRSGQMTAAETRNVEPRGEYPSGGRQ